MVKSNLLTSISLDIDTFKAHLKRISKAGYSVHPLDKDLLLQKTRNLYDKISQLELCTELIPGLPSPKVDKTNVEAKKEVEATVKQEVKKVESAAPPALELKEEVITEVKESARPTLETSKPGLVEEKVVRAGEEHIEKAEAPSPAPESTYDLFSASPATLSDKFVKEEASLADKLNRASWTI